MSKEVEMQTVQTIGREWMRGTRLVTDATRGGGRAGEVVPITMLGRGARERQSRIVPGSRGAGRNLARVKDNEGGMQHDRD